MQPHGHRCIAQKLMREPALPRIIRLAEYSTGRGTSCRFHIVEGAFEGAVYLAGMLSNFGKRNEYRLFDVLVVCKRRKVQKCLGRARRVANRQQLDDRGCNLGAGTAANRFQTMFRPPTDFQIVIREGLLQLSGGRRPRCDQFLGGRSRTS